MDDVYLSAGAESILKRLVNGETIVVSAGPDRDDLIAFGLIVEDGGGFAATPAGRSYCRRIDAARSARAESEISGFTNLMVGVVALLVGLLTAFLAVPSLVDSEGLNALDTLLSTMVLLIALMCGNLIDRLLAILISDSGSMRVKMLRFVASLLLVVIAAAVISSGWSG